MSMTGIVVDSSLMISERQLTDSLTVMMLAAILTILGMPLWALLLFIPMAFAVNLVSNGIDWVVGKLASKYHVWKAKKAVETQPTPAPAGA
jgi:hypothetical protein